jgi:hypothetical protein
MIVGKISGEKFQGDETIEAGVFGFINNAHTPTPELFEDMVVGDGLAEEGLGFRHGEVMLWGR